MANIAKVIRVIGQSDAELRGGDEGGRAGGRPDSCATSSGAHVVEMSAVVENDEITIFRTTVDIAFGVER